MASPKINSIGLFIDGGYFRKIGQGLAPAKKVHLVNMFNYIRTCISDNALFFSDMAILCHSEAFGFSSQKDNNH